MLLKTNRKIVQKKKPEDIHINRENNRNIPAYNSFTLKTKQNKNFNCKAQINMN